ncbi:MAG: hypothetical protein PHT40_02620 [Patescibacteria group bacterium]|nr:hypothetical protein [Patescibacteria group bacterium]
MLRTTIVEREDFFTAGVSDGFLVIEIRFSRFSSMKESKKLVNDFRRFYRNLAGNLCWRFFEIHNIGGKRNKKALALISGLHLSEVENWLKKYSQ